MHVVIDRQPFLKALSHGQSVVERRTTVPILSHVLLSAEGTALSLSTTDMDLALQEQIAAEVCQRGSFTVSAHMLFDIVRKLPDRFKIELKQEEGGAQAVLQAGPSRFHLPCLGPEQFPALGKEEFPHEFSLMAQEFKRLIERTKFAMSTEETRYYLNGIYFHAFEGHLRAVATDAHRLASSQQSLPPQAGSIPGVILSRKTVTEMGKLIGDTDREMRVGLSPSRIQFSIDQAVLTSRVIDGTYPDYAQVIPQTPYNQMRIHSKILSAAVDRVATMATDKLRLVKFSLSENTLILSAMTQETGSATEEIPVDYEGTPVDIGFNAKYLLDISQQLADEDSLWMLGDGLGPVLVISPSDPDSLFILMPMRI